MSIGIKKTLLGLAIGVAIFGLAIPIGYYFGCRAIDDTFGWAPLAGPGSMIIAGGITIAIGLFWVTWSLSYLIFVGKGLPVEAFGRALCPTCALVTTGPYAYTRNPMVIGYLLILLGLGLLARSISGLALVPVVALAAYIYIRAFEEAALVARFGADYETYRRKVPAIFPRLSAYIHGAE